MQAKRVIANKPSKAATAICLVKLLLFERGENLNLFMIVILVRTCFLESVCPSPYIDFLVSDASLNGKVHLGI
jgi:hypothetical protein